MRVNVITQRDPANKPGPDIVDELLSDEGAAKAKGTALIDHECSSRKVVEGTGPKNFLMFPCYLTEVIKSNIRYRGILTMYSRSYNKSGESFTMDSAMTVECQIEDTRPEAT